MRGIKHLLTFSFTLSCLLSFGQIMYDTSRVTLISIDTSSSWYKQHLNGNTAIILSNEQIFKADSILKVCISENNNNGLQSNIIGKYIGIHSFKTQFAPSINGNGEIIIWANCFCLEALAPEQKRKKKKIDEPEFDWRKEIFVIYDGGYSGCFFNVQINLTAKRYFNLHVNGI